MIVQVLPSISPHDAISQHVLRLDDEFSRNQIESKIVAHHISPVFADRVISPQDIDSFNNHHVIYRLSIASSLAEKVHSSSAFVDLWYHNITPAEYFEPWEPYVSLELRIARHQLAQMAVRADRGIAASHYSELELKQYGCRHTSVMPVLFDRTMKSTSMNTNAGDHTRILSVGRYAPHKRIEKLIQSLAMYRELVDANATLELVGSSSSRWYKESLEQLIESAGVGEAVNFHSDISDEELSHLYRLCDVYLCLSEHEGFCVPLVEAQLSQLPIVASDFAAIKETINGAGIILEPEYGLVDVVAAIDIVVHDDMLQIKLKEKARSNNSEHNIDEEAREAMQWFMAGVS
jgi:glycosyltransferase involved in cell wall biosynthesis